MVRKVFILFVLLLTFSLRGIAQQSCDLVLMPKSNNLCLEKSDYSVFKACRGNMVAYQVRSSSAISYQWSVTGGIFQLNSDSTVCEVIWGEGYSGMVIVEALMPDSTLCTSQIQVILKDRPIAGVVSIPNYVVDIDNPSRKILEVCAGDTLSFIDNSTSGELPIIDYYWEYPDGVSNSQSISFVPQVPGSYSVIHRVYNECGCYDEVQIKLIVNESCPLELSCFGMACAHSQQQYSVLKPNCSDYLWDVEGGTIVSSQHNPSVNIQWDAPESGYGMLYLDGTKCDCKCKSRKGIKIPVMSDNVSIKGPDTLCLNETCTFSLPLWGATQYSWSVSPSDPNSVSISENANTLTLTPLQKRAYTISVTFSCSFLGCGPYTVTKVIEVKDKLTISSNPSAKEVCMGSNLSFSTNTTAISQWTIELNNSIVHTIAAPSLSYTFDTCGVYVIRARNSGYCNVAQTTVFVKNNPPAPTDISGPDTICPNYTAEYSALPTSPNYYILWEWDTNGVTHTYAGNTVNITFGNTVNDIKVYQVDRKTGCQSAATVYHVSQFQIADWPYQNLIRICPGQTMTLSSLRDQADYDVLYEWEVKPAYPLSVQGPHVNAQITLLANYTNTLPDLVKLILKRTFCHTHISDTAYVLVGEIDPPAITHPPVCMGQYVSFSVDNPDDADKDASYWYLDNDSSSKVYGIPAKLSFADMAPHVVHLHYVSKYGCETDATDTIVPCPPLPDMHIEVNNDTLSVVINDSNNYYRYRWMTGETTSSIVVDSISSYYCEVTDPTCGCSRILSSNQSSSSYDCTPVNQAFSIINHCDNIISIGLTGIPGLTYPLDVRLNQNDTTMNFIVTSINQRILVPDTGSYSITIHWNNDDTCYYSTVTNHISTAIKFQLQNDCADSLIVRAQRTDGISQSVSVKATSTNLQDTINIEPVTGTDSVTISIPDTGWYDLRIQFDNQDCYINTLFHFDELPSIQNISISGNLCEQTAFTYQADATGEQLTYEWNFADGSWNYGNGIDHVYEDPSRHTIKLKVTDRNGCIDTGVTEVNVLNNPLGSYRISRSYDPRCPGDSAVVQTNQGYNLYSWSPCSQFTDYSVNVYEAGTYIVDITSNNEHCRKQLELNIPYPNGPFASIQCNNSYCAGDIAELIGYIGDGYTYKWYVKHLGNIIDSSADPNFDFHIQKTGNHEAILNVTDNNGCTSSDTAQFYVNPIPQAPVLKFCNNDCITNGPVEICSSDTTTSLLWSNGTYGISTQYFTDGMAEAYYIDPSTSCKSAIANISIPEAPNFDGLLSGCYRICKENFPEYFPLYTLGCQQLLSWEWYHNHSSLMSGSLPPSPFMLGIPSVGEYNLMVTYSSTGCRALSPSLVIELKKCPPNNGNNRIPSVLGTVSKKNCQLTDCNLSYRIIVSICNTTDDLIYIDNLYPITPIPYVITSGIPIMLGPGECRDVLLQMQYDFSSPSTFVFILADGSETVGSFIVNLSDWRDCLQPDTCQIYVIDSLWINSTLSEPNQLAFFDFSLTFPSLSGRVISVESNQGRIIDGRFSGATYSGLLMMDYGLMTQMVVDSADFCFNIICCDNDTICISTICIPYRRFWESCDEIGGSIRQKNGKGSGKEIPAAEGNRFVLVPNPATNKVNVVDQKDPLANDEIRTIEVFSLNGQKVIHTESTSQFDVSQLSTGSYIVKVVAMNRSEYLKLIKQ